MSFASMMLCSSVALCVSLAWGGHETVNYDEARVPPFGMADPLVFADGTPLGSPSDWPRRRAEILGVFAREMYGEEPPRPDEVVCERFEKGETLAGLAVREQWRMWFRQDKSGPAIDWLLVRPRYAKGRVPVVLQLNYYGNHDFMTDREVVLPRGWMQNERVSDGFAITNHCAEESFRGRLCRTDQRYGSPVDMLVSRGYAFLTATYADVSPDPDSRVDDMEKLPYSGVFALWGPREGSRTDNVTSLGAWAWALSRGLDLAERHPDLDAGRSVVTGCSRLGKAALLAAARDERFAVCVPVQTGKGGVPLAKRHFGENVHTQMQSFPHWFCAAYRKYVDNERELPFDQHLLLAAVAPRALLVLGFGSRWFDPKGEWLSVRAASPAWTFLGLPGLPDVAEPDFFSVDAIGQRIGYARREGKHGISGYDWQLLVAFADRQFLPLTRIGFMSDTHVGTTYEKCWKLKKSVELFKREGCDLIVNGGDIADSNTPTGYAAIRRIYDETFAGQKPPAEIFAYAWHDVYLWKGHPRAQVNGDVTACWPDLKEKLRIPHHHTAKIVHNGYTFLVFPQWLTGKDGFPSYEEYDRMIAESCRENPGKPVFVVDHVPPRGTVPGSVKWGDGRRRTVLDKYPQVVVLSGHVHGDVCDDRLLWQGGFTVVNAGCQHYWQDGAEGAAPTNRPAFSALTIDVFPGRLSVRRFDVREGKEVAAPWIVPLPGFH